MSGTQEKNKLSGEDMLQINLIWRAFDENEVSLEKCEPDWIAFIIKGLGYPYYQKDQTLKSCS